MKAKELIQILQLDPEADVKVSTVSYYERSFQDVGYKYGESQSVVSTSINSHTNCITLYGGEERL